MTFQVYGRSAHTLQGLVEQTFELHHERTAVITREGSLSYGDLAVQARQLAHYLNLEYSRAAQSPRLLAIFGVYGAEPIAAICGALVAGGGYVPLNPTFPVERTGYMIRDSGAKIVYVCDRRAEELEHLLPHIPEGTCVIVPDAILQETRPYPGLRFVSKSVLDEQPLVSNAPSIPENACAYILYTSGSTGTPKGVMVSHANVVYFIRELVSLYGLNENDRFSQTVDLTFDLSVVGLYGALATGGSVCPTEKIERLSPAAYVNNRRITVWSSVPSVVVTMQKLRLLQPKCMPTIRVSIFCGEPLTTSCACQWQDAACHSLVENTYGPTEATVLCSRFRWDAKAEAQEYTNGVVPLGTPLAGTGFAVVDAENRFLDGMPGELCITGPQLSLGYTSDEQNAKAFFEAEDPRFRVRQRWYKTGDVVTYNEDHQCYEFLGRIDSQVKVQGYRVELGEIERIIRTTYGCDAVVVVPHPVESGSAKGLVAFLEQVPSGASEASLREACEQTLPPYMCPTRFVFLPALPVNANGKYDRRTLYQECERDARSS